MNDRPETHGAKAVARQTTKLRVLQLRTRGGSFRAIAEVVGCSTGQAHKLWMEALAAICPAEEIREARAMELDRLDHLQLAFWETAIAGNIGALDTVLRIIDARARITGLYRPPVPYKDPQKMTSAREIETEMRKIIDEMNRRDQWAAAAD